MHKTFDETTENTCKGKKAVKGCPFVDDPEFMALTLLQQRFIYFYGFKNLAGWTWDKCYDIASPKDCTHQSARVGGIRMMKHEKVKPFLEKWHRIFVERMSMEVDRILQEELSLAYSNLVDYLDENGLIDPKEFKKLPRTVTAAAKSLEIIENPQTGEIKYKIGLWDKSASLARLQKIKGMHAPDQLNVVNTNINIDTDDPIEAARQYSQMLKGESSE